MIDQLRSLGIEKGKAFRPDAATSKQSEAGISEAHEWLEAKYDTQLKPFYDKGHWNFPADPELVKAAAASFDEPDAYPVDIRGLPTATPMSASSASALGSSI